MAENQLDSGANEQARGRLARIGYHFLSEPRCARVLFLSSDPRDGGELSPNGLARAFARAGSTAAVLDGGRDYVFYAPASPAARMLAREPRPASERLNEYWEHCRHPTVLLAHADDGPVAQNASVLFSVAVHDPGMRNAYLRLKSLVEETTVAEVGATILGAADRYQAEAAFDRFASAARRFIEIDVRSFSYIPRLEDPRDVPACLLDDVARLLLDDWKMESREEEVRETAP